MAHYAFLDENSVVTEVIVGVDETELIESLSTEDWYANFRGQKCVRTSYNGKIRKQYAAIGYTYNEKADVFVAPQPFPSWTLNKNHDWQAPVAYPDDGFRYFWSEETLTWKLAE